GAGARTASPEPGPRPRASGRTTSGPGSVGVGVGARVGSGTKRRSSARFVRCSYQWLLSFARYRNARGRTNTVRGVHLFFCVRRSLFVLLAGTLVLTCAPMNTGSVGRFGLVLLLGASGLIGCRSAKDASWEKPGVHEQDLLRKKVMAAREAQRAASE